MKSRANRIPFSQGQARNHQCFSFLKDNILENKYTPQSFKFSFWHQNRIPWILHIFSRVKLGILVDQKRKVIQFSSIASVVPFSCLQSFPASGSLLMTQFLASGGQSIGVSASASVFPMNIQDWFPSGWIGWISLQSRDSQESSPTTQFKSINSSALSFLYSPTLTSIHDYWKNHSFDQTDLCLQSNGSAF